jgi:hypothetical protein
MSTSHLRLVAAGLSLIVAVLAGVFTGFAGASEVCTRTAAQAPAAGQGAPTATPDGQDDGVSQGGRTNPGQHAPPQAATGERCEKSFSATSALAGFTGALLAALVVGGVALFVPRQQTFAPPPARPVSTPPAAADQQLRKDRATLVETCIYVRDRATSKAIADRLGWALQQVGVAEVTPTGVAFDPAHHEAGGAVATDDPRHAGTVAAVEIPGYTDQGAVLRAPVVTVYRGEPR